jgi:hypothetical protein
MKGLLFCKEEYCANIQVFDMPGALFFIHTDPFVLDNSRYLQHVLYFSLWYINIMLCGVTVMHVCTCHCYIKTQLNCNPLFKILVNPDRSWPKDVM